MEDHEKKFVTNDENEAQERAISDREGKTQELRSEQGEARYGSEGISFLFWKGLNKW